MFTHFFIARPILSSVISLLIVLAGAVSLAVSPIEQYPDMAPPQIQVTARYPGATAEVIANTVAAPLDPDVHEHQVRTLLCGARQGLAGR
jgi:multidrug efflux pump